MKLKYLITAYIALASSGIYAATISKVEHVAGTGSYKIIFKNASIMPSNTFAVTQPNNAIVLDFPNTKSGLKERQVPVANAGINSVDVIESNNRTRAVVNLAFPMVYKVGLQGKDVVVSVDTSGISAAVPKNAPSQISPDKTRKQVIGLSPTFRRGPNQKENRAVFSFNLPSDQTSVVVSNNNNSITADIRGYRIENSEQKRLEVNDFGTPVNSIDIRRGTNGSRITLNMGKGNEYEFITYQTGKVYTIEVVRPTQEDIDKKQLAEVGTFNQYKQYKGEPLSLNFQDIEVRAVLQIIAEFTGNNIVVNDNVVGNITLRLDNVPWDEALDIILKTKGLDKRINKSADGKNNVIYIATAEQLRKDELDALKTIEEKNNITQTQTEMIQVKYADANGILQVLERSRQAPGNTGGPVSSDSILSARGKVTLDPRSNTLIISDIPSKLEMARKLIAKLDEPVRQVLIDSRIVTTNDDFERSLGMNITRPSKSIDNDSYQYVNNRDYTPYSAPALVPVGGQNPAARADISKRLGVNMTSLSGALQLNTAILSGDFLVGAELNALQREGRAEVVSSPRVVTQDGVKANILSGQALPNQTTDGDGKRTVNYVDATVSLDVKPRITPDNMINMELNITNDAAGTADVNVAGDKTYPINKNQMNTSVLVDNGETLVLGGFYQHTQTNSNAKTPILGDIPIIGNAFKTKSQEFKKKEMLIFITPKIMDKRLVEYDKLSNLRSK